MKLYLAGGFGSSWQEDVKKRLPRFQYYDPRIDSSQLRIFQFAQEDLAGIDSCDLVLAYFELDNPSGIGLSIEVGYAVARGKRVIVVDEHARINGFLASCGEAIFTDIRMAIDYLGKLDENT